MTIEELTVWLREELSQCQRELELIILSNKHSILPDIVARRVVETQIMDYRNILRRITD